MNNNALQGERLILDDRLVSYVDAIHRYTGLSRSTADRMALRGDIPVVRVGRRVLVRESAIRRFVEQAEARTARVAGAAR